MQLRHAAAAAATLLLSLTLLLLPSAAAPLNITLTLSKYPEFSTFNHYLTATQLAPDINRRETITVCAVDNAAMAGLLSKHLDLAAIRNVLSLHILLDYFDAKKLHLITNGTALAATVFQATGSAPGSSGFVRITDLKGGKVGFSSDGGGAAAAATFVKSVEAVPYNFSVIQISTVIPSPAAESPAPAQSEVNLTAAMSAHGCGAFAGALLASAASETFADNVESGLTVFCPGDGAMKSFTPEFMNLTAGEKQSLLEYHGMPVYESLSGLRSSNGAANTLATDGVMQFSFTVQNDGNDVTVKSPIVTARIVGTVMDNPPVAIFRLDKVLMPKEIFKSSLPPSPAPAPAKAPKPPVTQKSPPAPAAPADAPAGDAAERKSDGGGVGFMNGGRFSGGAILSLWFVILLIF